MKKNFITLMAKNDHAHYPLRFMASDFFVPYWQNFLPVKIGQQYIPIIQDAARECVDYAMHGESIYWLIDFSDERA